MKPRQIIIDGVDKTGKTTTCQLLSKLLNMPIVKMKDMSKHFKDRPEEASEIFNKTIAQFSDFSFILDRGFPSSLVYNKYYNRKYDLDYLIGLHKKFKPQVFILIGNPRATDDIVAENEQLEIGRLYETYAQKFGWQVIDVDFQSPSSIVLEIISKLQ
jgi:thymidylate kinase